MAAQRNITVLRPADDCSDRHFVASAASPAEIYHIAGTEACNVRVEIEEGATAKVLLLALDGSVSEVRYRVEFKGSGGTLELYGLFLSAEGERRNIVTDVRHDVGGCTSRQTVKGVASGNGEGRFDGLVYVAPDAQQTEAYQQSRNLLLGDRAHIETLPQLEIYADDVRCSHGATVGQMNDEEIYYMRQRGIDEQEARRLQMSGFAHDIVAHCSDEALLAELTELVDNKIEML